MATLNDEIIEFYEELVARGETAIKAAAVATRYERQSNRGEELSIQRLREETNAAIADANRILGAQRLELQRENYEQTGVERRLRREQRARDTAAQQGYREQQAQYRQERDAQRQAYREQADADRARRRAEAQQQRSGGVTGGLSAPTVSSGTSGLQTGGGWEPDKASVAKFIILATVLGGIGAVANDVISNKPGTHLPDGAYVPAHLRSIGGAFVAGTIALIVNEVYPGAGAVLAAGIVGIIVIPNWTPIIKALSASFKTSGGGAFTGKLPPGATIGPHGGLIVPPPKLAPGQQIPYVGRVP